MFMNDKFENKHDDPKYDAASVMRDCAVSFLRKHKVLPVDAYD